MCVCVVYVCMCVLNEGGGRETESVISQSSKQFSLGKLYQYFENKYLHRKGIKMPYSTCLLHL